ncbi:MAG: T9SS type A sorting domain-containing protein [Candidatus Delongbacteria bacterium]|nr:T9SS type A sorting domain-containing protein [Candidatus Delongbacteria bacterium]
MKQIIVSLMLIISMFAFAAESAPSATVGYVKYTLEKPVAFATGLNMIALPFDESLTTSQILGVAITNCTQVNGYDATSQGWVASTKGPFGWDNVFATSYGNSYLIDVTAASEFISNGLLISHPAYSLLKPVAKTTGLNLIMHPFTKSGTAFDTSQELGIDITNCTQVNRYDATNQGWVASTKGPFGWDNVFATEIGKGLHVNVTADTTWPVAKAAVETDEIATVETPKGISRNVMYLVKTAADAYYDFSASPYGNITYRGWITTRPGEVLDETSAGSFYETFGVGYSFVAINIGNFATPWAVGDQVTFRIQQVDDIALPLPTPVFDEWITIPQTLDGTVNSVYGGAGTILADPTLGDPLLMTTPSSIEDNTLPLETKLHQNYPNPFNPTTTIKFDLASAGKVQLNVYNYTGQLVKTLVNGEMKAGFQSVNFDASSLSAGVYYYTMQTAGKSMTQKMVLIK